METKTKKQWKTPSIKNFAEEDRGLLARFSSELGLQHRIGWLQQKIMRLMEQYDYDESPETASILAEYGKELDRLRTKLANFTNAKTVKPCLQN